MERYLDELGARLVTLSDEKGFNMLHMAVLKDNLRKVRFLLYYAKEKQKESDESILNWLEEKSLKD